MKTNMMKSNVLALTCMVMLAAGSAFASVGSVSSPMTVTATIPPSCTITAPTLNFGTYLVSNPAPTTTTAIVAVNCMVGATGTITMDQGLYPIVGTSTAAVPARQMYDGVANYLAYFIYSDVNNSKPWNDGSTNPVTSVGAGTSVNFTVYGWMANGQNMPPGTYQDTVQVTVSF